MNDSMLPLGILLLGVSAILGFVALRPWPSTPSGQPIKPGAYVVEILEGYPPAASLSKKESGQQAAQVADIQNGLTAVILLYIATKLASGIASIVSFFGGS